MHRQILYIGVAVWVLFLSVTAVLAAPFSAPVFRDAPAGHSWWLDTAMFFREEGIIEGYSDGTFRPAQAINRAEMAKIVVGFVQKFLEEELLLAPAKAHFLDVPVSEWFTRYVQTGVEQRFFSGYEGEKYFGPTDSLTRAQALKVMVEIARAQQVYPKSAVPVTFSDTVASAWYGQYLLDGVGYAMIEGYPDGTFRPDIPVSRAEFVVMLNRTLIMILDSRGTIPVSPVEEPKEPVQPQEDEEDVSRQFESYLELHPYAAVQGNIPAGAVNVPYVHTIVQIKKEPVYLRSFSAKRDGVGNVKDFENFTFHVDGRRIGNAVLIDPQTEIVQFSFPEGIRLDKGSYTVEMRGHLRPESTVGAEHRFTILQNGIEITNSAGTPIPMEAAYPVYGAFWYVQKATLAGLQVVSEVRPVETVFVGATNVPLATLQLRSLETTDMLVRSIQLQQQGTIDVQDLSALTAWNADTGAILGYPTTLMPDGSLFLDFSHTPEGGMLLSPGATTRLELRGDVSGGVNRTVFLGLKEARDVTVLRRYTTTGLPVQVGTTTNTPIAVVDAPAMPVRFLTSTASYDGMTTIGALQTDRAGALAEGELRILRPYHGRGTFTGFSAVTQVVFYDDTGVIRVRKNIRPDADGALYIPLQGLRFESTRYHVALTVPKHQLPQWFFAELHHNDQIQHCLVGSTPAVTYAVTAAMPVISGTRDLPLSHVTVQNTTKETITIPRMSFLFSATSWKDFTGVAVRQFGKAGSWSLTQQGDLFSLYPTGLRIAPGERLYFTVTAKPRMTPTSPGRILFVPEESTFTHAGTTTAFAEAHLQTDGKTTTNPSSQASLDTGATLLGSFMLGATYDQLSLERVTISGVDPTALRNVDTLYLVHNGNVVGAQTPDTTNEVLFSLPTDRPVRIPSYERIELELYAKFRDAQDAVTQSGQHLALYVRDIRVTGTNGDQVRMWSRTSTEQVTVQEDTQTTFRVSGARVRVGDILYTTAGNVFEYVVITGIHTGYAQEGDIDGLTIGMIKVQRMVGPSSGMAFGSGTVDILEGMRTGTTQVLAAPFTIRETPSWIPQTQGAPFGRSDRWSIDVATAGSPNSTASVDARLHKLRLTVYGSAHAQNFVMRSRHSGKVVAVGVGSHAGGTAPSHIIFDLSGAELADIALRPGMQRTYTFDADVQAPGSAGGNKSSLSFSIASLGTIDSKAFGVDTDVVWQDTNYSANGGAGRTVDVYWIDTGETGLHMKTANQYTAS